MLVRATSARPRLTIVVSLLCALAGVLFTVRDLTFVSSGRDLLPPDKPYVQRHKEYGRDFGELDSIVVAIEGQPVSVAKAYARRITDELAMRPDIFQRVTYRIDPQQFEGRELLYLAKQKLVTLRDQIFDHERFMTSFAAHPTLEQLIDNIGTEVITAFAANFLDLGLTDSTRALDVALIRDVLDQMSGRLDGPVPYHSPWSSLLSLRREEDKGYFVSDDQRLVFVLVESAGTKGFTGDREAIDTLRATIAHLTSAFPDVRAGVTGAPALRNDEMVAAFRDSRRATILAFILTLGVLIVAFRRIGMSVLMLATLAVSLCWAMGIITLVVGHLSIFSVMFISIVIGIGTDYGIYFLFRHDEELARGHDQRAALETTALRTGPGMLSGSLTAAGAFYVLMRTDFRGISELGFIAGTSILLAWLAMMTLFPALIVLAEPPAARRADRPLPVPLQPARVRVPFLERVTRYPKAVMGAAAAATVLSVVILDNVQFDYNLLHLQARDTESVLWEQRILRGVGPSSFTGLASATSLAELRQKVAAFEHLGSVSEVDSALVAIPADQAEKRTIVSQLAPIVAPVRIGIPAPVNVDRLIVSLYTLRRRLDVVAGEAPAGHDRDELVALHSQLTALIVKLAQTDRRRAEAALTRLQDDIEQDFTDSMHTLQRNLSPPCVGLNDVPGVLRRKYIGRSGRLLLEIHPKVNIWDRPGAERFVADLRSVDPDVTGTAVITFEAIRAMEHAYRQGTLYALLLVAALSALILRRHRETVLAMLSLGLGTLWTLGLMHAFGLPFNLANVFGLPLIIGAGAEFGLNVVLRYLEGRDRGGPLVARSTVMAVLVNGLTTMVGFGSLLIAAHRGIFGLGLLLTLGMISTLTASLIVLPVMLRWSQPLPSSPRGAPPVKPVLTTGGH